LRTNTKINPYTNPVVVASMLEGLDDEKKKAILAWLNIPVMPIEEEKKRQAPFKDFLDKLNK